LNFPILSNSKLIFCKLGSIQMKILNDITICDLKNWIEKQQFIRFRFNWKEMGCKIVVKHIEKFAHDYDVDKKTQKRHKFE